ncbi:Biotin carboxyl carrier protein subunit of of Het-ACCase (BCCP1), partial [Corchorus capsularis]
MLQSLPLQVQLSRFHRDAPDGFPDNSSLFSLSFPFSPTNQNPFLFRSLSLGRKEVKLNNLMASFLSTTASASFSSVAKTAATLPHSTNLPLSYRFSRTPNLRYFSKVARLL